MNYQIIITEQADQNLENIGDYIAEDNPARAISFIREIRGYLEERLSHFPFSAKLVTNTIRMLPYKRYSVLYIVDEDQKSVKILHIFAGGQDWESII